MFFVGLIFLPIAFVDSFRSCVFTSQKIIFKKLNKIGTTTYINITSITYYIQSNTQHIYLDLKQPMDSTDFKNKTDFSLRFLSRKLNLYEQMIEIKDQSKN